MGMGDDVAEDGTFAASTGPLQKDQLGPFRLQLMAKLAEEPFAADKRIHRGRRLGEAKLVGEGEKRGRGGQ